MMFILHISFSSALLTLALGCALLAWSKREAAGSAPLKFGGAVVVIFSILNLLCIGYYGVLYRSEGSSQAPSLVSSDSKMCSEMKDRMKCMMGKMKGMEGEGMKAMPSEGSKPPAALPEGHQEHH